MYPILQTKAKDYILSNLLLINPRISYADADYSVIDPVIDSDNCGISPDLESLIYREYLKCTCTELIVHIFQIYGVNIRCTNNKYYYQDDNTIIRQLKCSIGWKEWVVCYVNNDYLHNPNETMLLELLTDPLKTIDNIFEDALPNMKGLFCIVKNSIHNKIHHSIREYWLLCQVCNDWIQVNDVKNLILDVYAQLLL